MVLFVLRLTGIIYDLAAAFVHVLMNKAGQAIAILSRMDLIAMKNAAGRPKDVQDVRWLERGTDDGHNWSRS